MDQIRPSFIREILAVTARPGVISFAGGLPHPDTFPRDAIATAATRALSEAEGRRTLQYTETQGDGELRAWIAGRYRTRFGWDVDPDLVIVVNGSQQALDLVGKVLLDPGADVVIEEPTYLGALQGLAFHEPVWRSVAAATGGLDLGEAADALRGGPPLMYAIPTFQNPTGRSYDDATRDAVAGLLESTVLVEDDPYGELRYRGDDLRPIAPRRPELTVLMGSFSKTVAPGLRLGWMVVPPWLREPLLIAKQAADLHSNHLSQRVLVHLLAELDFDAHLTTIRARYRAGLEAMEAAIDAALPEVERSRPDGGMFLWATLPADLTARAVLEEAMARDVVFVPGDAFSPIGGSERSIRLSFCTVDPAAIEDGVARLAEAIEATRSGNSSSPASTTGR